MIENEFGEVGIDDDLLKKNTRMQADEEIIEMMNGCICCTVRQDLVVVLDKLAKRVQAGTLKLDGIVIETTGMADPAPVAQTFFVDEQVRLNYELDAIITVVDSKHVIPHLDEERPEGMENEAVEQVCASNLVAPFSLLLCLVYILYHLSRSSKINQPHYHYYRWRRLHLQTKSCSTRSTW